jgi:hypothetical protein
MRRVALLSVGSTFALASVALAALTYQTGTYKEGGQSGFKRPGVRIDISHGSFNVERILMHEVCTAPGRPSVHDFGGFQEDSKSKLVGKITKTGKFSGKFSDGAGGYVKVTGNIKGSKLTVVGSEFVYYTPPSSTVRQTCRASGTFHPKRQ